MKIIMIFDDKSIAEISPPKNFEKGRFKKASDDMFNSGEIKILHPSQLADIAEDTRKWKQRSYR